VRKTRSALGSTSTTMAARFLANGKQIKTHTTNERNALAPALFQQLDLRPRLLLLAACFLANLCFFKTGYHNKIFVLKQISRIDYRIKWRQQLNYGECTRQASSDTFERKGHTQRHVTDLRRQPFQLYRYSCETQSAGHFSASHGHRWPRSLTYLVTCLTRGKMTPTGLSFCRPTPTRRYCEMRVATLQPHIFQLT
jgi:hypothetical protein